MLGGRQLLHAGSPGTQLVMAAAIASGWSSWT
jgi:hypothetical protein